MSILSIYKQQQQFVINYWNGSTIATAFIDAINEKTAIHLFHESIY